MKNRTLATLAVLAASSLTSTYAYGQTHTDSFTYQGTLQDSGAPADGFYDITFLIYSDEVGGAPITSGTASVLNVEAVGGVFEAFVDFGVSGIVFDSSTTRWLELQVSQAGQPGFTTLAPRQRIAPAPLANYALRAGQADHATTSGSTLQDAFNNGNEIFFNNDSGIIEFHSTASQGAALRINNQNGDPRAVFFENGFGYGDLAIYGDGSQIISRLYNDTSAGGGGYLAIARNNTGAAGIILEGNQLGSEASLISIFGADRSIHFNTNAAADASVILPADAINSSEILNEVGVAESVNASLTTLTQDLATIDVIDSVTLNAPADGFALVLATAECSISHAGNPLSSVNLGVSNSPFVMQSHSDIEIRIPQGAIAGLYDYPVTVHSILPVTTGANTFYLLGDQNFIGGQVAILDRQLSAIYIPTAYGTATLGSGLALDDHNSPITPPMSQFDIASEREAALRADLDRQQRELDAMKAQMQQLLEQSDRTLNQQSQD